jgi:hypothetical protein
MDRRFKGMADKLSFSYTRYADDLSFSANGNEQTKKAQQLLWRIKKIITEEGFTIHPKKVKVMRKGAKQEVTGIIVNKKPGVDRKMLHRFRALIHQIAKHGLDNKKWKGGNIISEMVGYANFVAQVKPVQGNKFKTQLRQVFANPAIQQQIQNLGLNVSATPKKTAAPSPGKNENKEGDKNWWDIM